MKTCINKNNKTFSFTFAMLICLCSFVFSGCNPRESELQQEHANTYLSDEELEGYEEWVKNKETYAESYEELLLKVDEKIVNLEKQMANMSLKKQAQVREDIKHLEKQRVIMQNNLDQLDQANEQNWEELRNEIEQVADSLNIYLEEVDKNVEFG